jgi:hypothetical protein
MTQREQLEARLSVVRGQLAAASGRIRAATMALVEGDSTDALEEMAGALLQSAALGQVAEELGALVKAARIAELEAIISEKQALIKTKYYEGESKRRELDGVINAIFEWDRRALRKELSDGGLAERVAAGQEKERLLLESRLIQKELRQAKNDLLAAENELAALRGERDAAHWSLGRATREERAAAATTSAAGQ